MGERQGIYERPQRTGRRRLRSMRRGYSEMIVLRAAAEGLAVGLAIVLALVGALFLAALFFGDDE